MCSVREQRFPKSAASVRAARQFTGDVLAGWRALDRWDDIRLCVSELAANAVRHGVPDGRDFQVRISCSGDRVVVEVRDSGRSMPEFRRVGPQDVAGRGLWIVSRLADAFGVLDEAVGKSVWATFKGAMPDRDAGAPRPSC